MSNSERSAKRSAFSGLDAELGPAQTLSAADTEWLAEQVVERALEPAKRPRPRLLSLRALSLAALAVVTSAAAATVVYQVHKSAASHTLDVRAPQRQSKKTALGRLLPQSTSDLIAEPAASADTTAPPRELTTPSTNSPNSTLPEEEVTAADELSRANELRRKAQWQAAEAAYRDIAVRYPQTQEATVAQLVAAELRLDHLGDPAGALQRYQAVPRSNALGVEALFGISRSYRALGDRAAEAAALRSLLESYPASLQADGARGRLKQLAAESVGP